MRNYQRAAQAPAMGVEPQPQTEPQDGESWRLVPSDVVACVIERLLESLVEEHARPAAEVTAWLAAIRAVCAPWRDAVDGCLAELRLRALPPPAFLSRFPALRVLDLTALAGQLCGGGGGGAAARLEALLARLPHVEQLRSLALPECGAAELEPALALLQVRRGAGRGAARALPAGGCPPAQAARACSR